MENKNLVYVDYDVWMLPDEEGGDEILFRTTDRIKAEKEDIFEENIYYGPQPIMFDSGEISDGFEEALKDAEPGKKGSVTVPPEKGAGQRDPRKIELFSRRELDRKGIDIVEGGRVDIDNRTGTIIQATSGRVRVDFNNPLAGRTIKYDYIITDIPETPEDIVKAILLKDYDDVEFKVEIREDSVDVIIPDVCKYDQAWYIAKYMVVGDIRKLLGLDSIRFIEVYEKKGEDETLEEEIPEESSEETADEGSQEEDISEDTADEEIQEEDISEETADEVSQEEDTKVNDDEE